MNYTKEQISILKAFADHKNSQDIIDHLDSKNLFQWFRNILLEVAE